MAGEPAKGRNLGERISLAWSTISSSVSVPLWGLGTAAVILEKAIGWTDKLQKIGLWPTWAPTTAIVIYTIISALFLRAVFLIAESKALSDKNREKAERARKALLIATDCMHTVVHETRNTMLSDGKFRAMVAMTNDARLRFTHEVVAVQLGMMEKAFRALTDGECCVTLKITTPIEGKDLLKSVAYSPSTPLARRERTTLLPTNQGIAQEAMLTRQIAYVDDIQTDNRFWPRERRDDFATRYRTVVASPVVVNGNAVGALCFDWPEPNQYREEFRHVVAAFTDVVSTACYLSAEAYTLNEAQTSGGETHEGNRGK